MIINIKKAHFPKKYWKSVRINTFFKKILLLSVIEISVNVRLEIRLFKKTQVFIYHSTKDFGQFKSSLLDNMNSIQIFSLVSESLKITF